MKHHIKAFTLIELLIVITIMGLFMSVLFRTYTNMGQLSAKVQNEQFVNHEYLYTEHTLSNILQVSTIDYSYYTGGNTLHNGYATHLYLTGSLGPIQLYTTGSNCFSFRGNKDIFSSNIFNEQCRIEAKISGNIMQITDPHKVYVSNIIFQLLPSKYYQGDQGHYFDNIQDIQAQALHIRGYIWVKNRSTDWIRNAYQPLELFYSL